MSGKPFISKEQIRELLLLRDAQIDNRREQAISAAQSKVFEVVRKSLTLDALAHAADAELEALHAGGDKFADKISLGHRVAADIPNLIRYRKAEHAARTIVRNTLLPYEEALKKDGKSRKDELENLLHADSEDPMYVAAAKAIADSLLGVIESVKVAPKPRLKSGRGE
jgi:hypothetical protein